MNSSNNTCHPRFYPTSPLLQPILSFLSQRDRLDLCRGRIPVTLWCSTGYFSCYYRLPLKSSLTYPPNRPCQLPLVNRPEVTSTSPSPTVLHQSALQNPLATASSPSILLVNLRLSTLLTHQRH